MVGRKFLYRGLRTWIIVTRIIANGLGMSHSFDDLKEFGAGLYTTPDLDYALQYARKNGALLVFDWSDSGGDVTTKMLDDVEWKTTVKGWICLDDPSKAGPPQHPEDILEGAVSLNYEDVYACREPQPSHYTQVVGKTDASMRAFAARLFAIIYLYVE
jgi:hypothetical protein